MKPQTASILIVILACATVVVFSSMYAAWDADAPLHFRKHKRFSTAMENPKPAISAEATNGAIEKPDKAIVLAPPEAALKELSIKVTPRLGKGKKGGVVQIENTGIFPLDLSIIIHRGDQTNQLVAVINSGSIRNIGEEEGWGFASGDVLEIKSGGHRSTNLTFP